MRLLASCPINFHAKVHYVPKLSESWGKNMLEMETIIILGVI